MKLTHFVLLGGFALSACAEVSEGVAPLGVVGNLGAGGVPLRAVGVDGGFDATSLTELQAGIWIDPDGCQVWMIDDGVEGYWSRRRDPRTGLPVCVPIAPPGSIVGDIEGGAGVTDWVPIRR